MKKYVLITPARNEEAFIEKTLQSVVAQTIPPQCWVIVNDGSTDRTGEIVGEYAAQHDFIDVMTASGDSQRNFGSKSKAIQAAYESIQHLDFDYVGNLDADISFEPDYYSNILEKMEENPKLGLAGGVRYDWRGNHFVLIQPASNSVGGPIQLFRRETFEAIGGYQVLPYGGIDAVAETSTRMHGWEVKSFPEYHVYHHRATGTANRSIWSARYRAGIRDYTIGYHPLFAIARSATYVKSRPYLVGAFVMLAGYVSAAVRGIERPVPPEYINYLHQEQMQRLRKLLRL